MGFHLDIEHISFDYNTLKLSLVVIGLKDEDRLREHSKCTHHKEVVLQN